MKAIAMLTLIGMGHSAFSAPPNDDFTNRVVIPSLPAAVAGTTVDGTLEMFEPQAYHQLSTVWYQWTADRTGIVRVYLSDASDQLLVTIYSGAALTNLQVLDISSLIEANVSVQAGGIYQFRVAANQETPYPRVDGPFILRLEYNVPPSNDHFTNRIRLTNTIEHIEFRNVGATRESFEELPGGRSVWYQWRASSNGIVRLQNDAGYNGAGIVGVYAGTEQTLGTLITNGTSPGLTFAASSGQTYHFVFDDSFYPDRNRPFGASWMLTLSGASRFLGALRRPAGLWRAALDCDATSAYVFEASTNLIDWTPLWTNGPFGQTSLPVGDLDATNFSQRFYRAKSVAP